MDKKVVALFNRMIAMQENSPMNMDVLVKTIHGRQHGTVRWTTADGKMHIRRWISNNMAEVVSELTSALIAYLYDGVDLESADSFADKSIVVRYQWNNLYKDFYHGFDTESELLKWTKFNDGWMIYERMK